MNIEWDAVKAALNLGKHGVSFADVEPAFYKAASMRNEYDFSKAKRGPVVGNKGKTRITIYLDDDVIAAYRDKAEKLGRGYQTLINEALRETLKKPTRPVDARTLRRILKEELKAAGDSP